MTTVRLHGVGKTYARGRTTQALDGVDLDVASGEFVTVIGPSGCGKSTLLRVVGGLVPADRGEVRVGQQTPDEARRTKLFGLVPQTPALLPWKTVQANARVLVDVHRGRESHGTLDADATRALLVEVGLGDFLTAYPRELSGGMQQRVALVRAFALGAPVLLMDEPFAALDQITRSEMRYLLLRLWARTDPTVLFVTHSIAEAVILSDRVVVMSPRPGRIVHEERITLDRPRHADQEDTVAFLGHVAAVRRALATGMEPAG